MDRRFQPDIDHHRFQHWLINGLNLNPNNTTPYTIPEIVHGLPELKIPKDQNQILTQESQISPLDLKALKIQKILERLSRKYNHYPQAMKKIQEAQDAIKSKEFHIWNKFLNHLESLMGSDQEITCKEIIDKLRKIYSPHTHFQDIKINSIIDEELNDIYLIWKNSQKTNIKNETLKDKLNSIIHQAQGKSPDGFTPQANLQYLLIINQQQQENLQQLKTFKESKKSLDETILLLRNIRKTRDLIQEIKESLGIDPKKGNEQEQIKKLKDKYQI